MSFNIFFLNVLFVKKIISGDLVTCDKKYRKEIFSIKEK